MRLSKVERLILSNQFRILEKLYPEEQGDFANFREAVETGFEIEYDWHAQYIEKDVLSIEECTEIIDILAMFDSLNHSLKKTQNISDVAKRRAKFAGFDGNHEVKQLAYTHYLRKNGKFSDLLGDGSLNSHIPMLTSYRRMLKEWIRSDNQNYLTEDDIARIATATTISSFIEQLDTKSEDERIGEIRSLLYQSRGHSEVKGEAP